MFSRFNCSGKTKSRSLKLTWSKLTYNFISFFDVLVISDDDDDDDKENETVATCIGRCDSFKVDASDGFSPHWPLISHNLEKCSWKLI